MKKVITLVICLGSFTFLSVGQSPQKEMGSLFPILQNGKWGYINANGDVVIEPQFDSVGEFHEGLAVANLNGKRGYINEARLFVIQAPASLILAGGFSEGLAPVIEGGKHGYIDRSGNMVIAPQYDFAGEFSLGIARIRTDDKFGFIDRHGALVTGLYPGAFDFSEGLAPVEINGKMGYIDVSDRIVI